MAASMTETMPMTGIQQMETMHMKLHAKSSTNMAPHPPAGTKPKGRLRLDPQRALEPAKKKLSTLESQRIMAALDETIKRTGLVLALPFVLKNMERFRVVLGSELVRLLLDHAVTIQSFDELKQETERLFNKENEDIEVTEEAEEEDTECHTPQDEEQPEKQMDDENDRPLSAQSTGSRAEAAMRNLSLVAKQMQANCKNILRAFQTNPAAISAVLKEHNEKSESGDEMITQLNELKDILMNMLLTTPVEEQERNQYLREISERERHNAGVIDKLETELQSALEDKDNDIKKKNDVIRHLQADLHQIEKFSEEHIRRTKSEAEKQEAADHKNSEGKCVKLQQEMAQLKGQLQKLVEEHRENEGVLRRKKFQVETEVENWIQNYDQNMGERQDEFEEIDAVYTEEKKQLHELEERFKTLETEYNQIQEERRIARERREAAERELQTCIKAATCIQAFWRSFKVRKALKSKKKKKGGGKKKGKK